MVGVSVHLEIPSSCHGDYMHQLIIAIAPDPAAAYHQVFLRNQVAGTFEFLVPDPEDIQTGGCGPGLPIGLGAGETWCARVSSVGYSGSVSAASAESRAARPSS